MKLQLMVAAALVGLAISAGAVQEKKPAKPAKPAVKGKGTGKVVTTKSGLKYIDLKVGTGTTAVNGKHVVVNYVGTLTNGKKFDASKDHGGTFDFDLPGNVIAGWNEGVQGMKIGGKRKLVVPPSLGYGDRAMGDAIPANSTLIFEIDLLEVK